MNRMWTDESLSQLSDSVNGKFAGLASAVSDAMTEVHENMKELEGNICTDEEARGGVARLQEALDAVDSAVALLRNEVAGIAVPTKVSELQNDSGYKTTDSDTWKANTASSEGYVAKGFGNANKVWKTDANGNPGWRNDDNTTYNAATASAAGLMSAADKSKLDGIQAGAQVNVSVTKASIGLGSVDNTPDASKSVNYANSAGSATNATNAVNATNATKATNDGNGNNIANTYAIKNVYGNSSISIGRKANTTIGNRSVSWGYECESSGSETLALGWKNTASGEQATAIGASSKASGDQSFASGGGSVASGTQSIANGKECESCGNNSVAEGQYTKAIGHASYAFGHYTTADGNMACVIGHRNVATSTSATVSNKLGHALVIGNGLSDTSRSNALSVLFDGTVKAAKTITGSTAADYAEMFEKLREELDGRDIVGRFVTLEGKKIRLANGSDDYILGIVSGNPFVLGNADCDAWNGMYLRDDFGRLIMEPAPKTELCKETGEWEEVFDDCGQQIFEGERPVLNPDYDSSQAYISRADRPEWEPIGMLGVLSVVQDGTLVVNGYCMCGENGIATACDLPGCGYRVTEIVNENVAKVVFREALPVSVGRKLQKLFENES